MKLDILADNEWFVAVNKPSGMLSIPDRMQSEPSLKDILKEKYETIFTVHRLDKDTSGIIVFAKDEETHKQLSQLFEGREVKKHYLGLVNGTLMNQKGSVDAAIMEHPAKNGTMAIHANGKASLTDYEVLESFGIYSWVQFQIHTGRTHQIRVHTKHIGHSIACDPLYGDGLPVLISSLKKRYNLAKKEEEEKPILARLGLHAASLQFSLNGQDYSFEAPLPKDIRASLQQLRKWKG
ncbi:RluA family pseudouridine synthase [Parasediminibacterium sp. JCM 36343]|uniref:RluA family pseudouridine synthase n=1 Tax=Parasediminibacterium sp. JCM 36343 TaxID=3374279 RepID=UPI00397B946B